MEKSQNKAKEEILFKIKEAISHVPKVAEPDLPADKELEVPKWHKFEFQVWDIGEKIRLLLLKNKKLIEDEDIQKGILSVVLDKKAKRGRQSFVMLLGSKSCQKFASKLASQIKDNSIDGHIIHTLHKMHEFSFVKEVEPFLKDKKTWVRNEAKKYLARSRRVEAIK